MTWLINNWDQVLIGLYEHVIIAATSLAIAFAISLVVGILAASIAGQSPCRDSSTRYRRLRSSPS